MITYEPFWLYVGRYEKVTTYDLIKKHGISSNTLNRMRHNKPISTATLDKLCKIMDCNVYDIISYEPDKPQEDKIPTCQQVDNKANSAKVLSYQ